MYDARTAEVVARWRAITPVVRKFIGGCIDGEERECRSHRRIVRSDIYQLVGDDMVYQCTREASVR